MAVKRLISFPHVPKIYSDIYLYEVIVRNDTPHYLKPKIKPEEKLRTMTFARVVFCRPCMCSRFVVPPIMRKIKRV